MNKTKLAKIVPRDKVDNGGQGKGSGYWVPGGQRVCLGGPRGSRGRPTGSQVVKGVGLEGARGSSGRFDGLSDDLKGVFAYTRSYATLRAADLEWIVRPGYSWAGTTDWK